MNIHDFLSPFPAVIWKPKLSLRALSQVFTLFGLCGCVHSDSDSSFMSRNFVSYMNNLGIPTSKCSVYNPWGNGQCDKYNDVIWSAVKLALQGGAFQFHSAKLFCQKPCTNTIVVVYLYDSHASWTFSQIWTSLRSRYFCYVLINYGEKVLVKRLLCSSKLEPLSWWGRKHSCHT